ncbi:Helix-turn-helix domain protein [Oceanobacillus picturae]|uniref:Helix-turn-helix domain protein n=1 Tax=Oceanobacillus picturae TaxID=171693 RepID=W9AFV4_9BACI|nr:metalloregulator ArsR/SmtB family transcription factor [Oceanobacillus picturae]CDO04569.1 Helix-turn-helix domain protein [Oceanobacillus picturae]
MEVINATSLKRKTYQVDVKYSLLWECALGIAAITNTPLLDSLEKPMQYWKTVRETFSNDMRHHLEWVEKHNTWKALLQLLHQRDFLDLKDFATFIHSLDEKEFRYICIPFVGMEEQVLRRDAADGDQEAMEQLQTKTEENPFFPRYIEYICKVGVEDLKRHLVAVMTGWYDAIIAPDKENVQKILHTDIEAKLLAKEKMTSEALVAWATSGINYAAEPGVHRVLLIPHMIYRPWSIVADLEDTKVFYYPVANESIAPEDSYMPNNFLVLRHKALGDEMRLRIVKLLFEKSRSLNELTGLLKLGKSTIHHHLKILRSAKLVEIKNSRYVLKQHALFSLSEELELYLHQE